MTEINANRQKRNKPCENCRTHRRKCIHYNNSICERCYKLNLNCIYLITEKPTIQKSDLKSIIKGKQLFETVWYLEQEIHDLQIELSRLKQQQEEQQQQRQQQQQPEPQQIKTLPGISDQHWALTIKRDNFGIHVQTSVQSIHDLSLFLKSAVNSFVHNKPFFPELSFSKIAAGNQLLKVTRNTIQVETLFLKSFTTKSTPEQDTQSLYVLSSYQLYLTSLKTQLIHTFFHCQHYLSPLFVFHYHYPLLSSHPDSLLSTAIASFVAYSPCIHMQLPKNLSVSRLQLAEFYRLETKKKLEDYLFIPDIDTCIALYYLSFSSLYALKISEARLQSTLCWNMIHQLKYDNGSLEDELQKRLYHLERYLEFNMRMLYDRSTDFSNITFYKGIGMPAVQDMDDEISVICFQSLTRLITNASKQDENIEMIGLQLMAGVISTIPTQSIEVLENSLLELWDSLPSEIQLGNGPYSWMEDVVDCQHPAILRFNASYYVYWMNFQSRVMHHPHKTDLTGAVLSRLDGDRALLIVSICTDAVTKIFKQLTIVSPCAIELHWLSICIDMLKLLSTSINQTVQSRAKENLHILTSVLEVKLDSVGTNRSPYTYQLQKLIARYMAVKNICTMSL